jgi:hypothetical protein
MCRIARFFLLQRLKGSVSGDAREINNIELASDHQVFFSCKARRRLLPVQLETSPSVQPVVLSAAEYINCTVGLKCLNTAMLGARSLFLFQSNTSINVDNYSVQTEETSIHYHQQ